ncbi:MAG: hypothetical protein V2B18_17700 [Pseudomonadota bacterium]
MMDQYSREWALAVSEEAILRLFYDLETILRLAPQWNVKALRMDGPPAPGRTFELDVEHDRTETVISFSGQVKSFVPRKVLHLVMESSQNTVDFAVSLTERAQVNLISFHISSVPPPALEDLREYDLWARSVLNYLKISESRSPTTRLWKCFLDRWWLRMTQSGKRLVFFIVVADGFSVIFLVAILLWWKYFSSH